MVREISPNFFKRLEILENKDSEETLSRKGALLGSLFTALTDFIQNSFKSKIGSLILEDMKITVKTTENYIIAIFTDINYEGEKKIIKDISDNLERMNIEVEILDFRPNLKSTINQLVDRIIFDNPLDVKKLRKIIQYFENEDIWSVNELDYNLDASKKNELKLDTNIPKMNIKNVSIEDLVEGIYKGNYWETIFKAKNVKNGLNDLISKVILTVAGLLLRTSHPDIPVLDSESLRIEVSKLENRDLRNLLLDHINLFDTTSTLRKVVSQSDMILDKLGEIIEKDPKFLPLYDTLIALRSMYSIIPRNYLEEKLNFSPNLSILVYIYKSLTYYYSPTQKNSNELLDKWVSLSQKTRHLTRRTSLKDVIDYCFISINILKNNQIDKNLRAEIARQFINRIGTFLNKELIDDENITNTIKGFIFFTYTTALKQLMTEMSNQINSFEKHEETLIKIIAFTAKVLRARRDTRLNIHIYISSELATYSFFMRKKKIFPRLIMDLTKELLADNIMEIYYIDRRLFTDIYANYVQLLKNISHGIEDGITSNHIKAELKEAISKIKLESNEGKTPIMNS
ncbi:MAG: hypothetical protein ACP6IP_03050 [Candidatus Njordarchaeia archaeon]